jgi:ABC-type polysaccharide/polyol phosphate transport system ATPase subunit
MITQCCIELKDVSKSYPKRISQYLPCVYGGKPNINSNCITSLDGVSLEIKKGEILGVIGRNGAGKSTLLRLIAGISKPTRGSISVKGTVTTLLNLSAGLQSFQTARQNIFINLELFGIKTSDASFLVDEIIEFSELGEYIDCLIATYSSGMKMRLAFSIATAVQSDILLIDEALAVGDEFFSAKSFNRIEKMAKSGITCVIVSHDWNKIFRLATRVVWLDDGKIKADDLPSKVLHPYLLDLNAFSIEDKVTIQSVKFLDNRGNEKRIFHVGEDLCLRVSYLKKPGVDSFSVISGVMLASTGESVLSVYSLDENFISGIQEKREGIFEINFSSLRLYPGEYDVTILTASVEQGAFPTSYYSFWGPQVGSPCRITLAGMNKDSPAPLLSLDVSWNLKNCDQ